MKLCEIVQNIEIILLSLEKLEWVRQSDARVGTDRTSSRTQPIFRINI
nr:MAG TPA: hypothetical protein [Caudoviricetes sp.]